MAEESRGGLVAPAELCGAVSAGLSANDAGNSAVVRMRLWSSVRGDPDGAAGSSRDVGEGSGRSEKEARRIPRCSESQPGQSESGATIARNSREAPADRG